MKKLLSILLATTLIVCNMTGLVASAVNSSSANAAQPTAKIVIQNNNSITGISLEGRTFDVYKVFSASVNNEAVGNATISYVVEDAFKAKLEALAGSSDAKAIEQYIHDQYDANNSALMQVLAKELRLVADTLTPIDTISGTVEVNSGIQTLSSSDLAPGYYLVIDKSTGKTITAPIMVSIPTRDTAEDFTQNAVINIKGSQPEVDKEIWHDDLNAGQGDWDNVGDYQIGDTVKFIIEVDLPADITGHTEYFYYLTDTMSEGLTFKSETLKLFFEKEMINQPEGNHHTTTITGNTHGEIFTIKFDVKAIREKFSVEELTKFYVYYEAVLNEDAQTAIDFEKNTVELVYNNNPYDSTSTGKDEDDVKAYTFGINVSKVDTAHNPLANAKFGLFIKPAKEDAELIPVFVEEKVADSNEYHVAKGTTVPAENKGVIVTDSKGKFTIKGLNDAVTYVLRELDAPEGYTEAADVVFKINVTYDKNGIPTITTTNSDVSVGSTGSLETEIINTSSSLFPGTGGMGTPIFLVGGILVMAIALLMSRKSTKDTRTVYKK